MIESNSCRAQQKMGTDLLPWADPYIMQLFAESEQWSRSGLLSEPSARTAERLPEAAGDADAVVTAQFCSESWQINAPRRPAAVRRRRIESERLLARC
jgi:hypothetical protein